MAWHPISSAEKSGVHYLLYDPTLQSGGHRVFVGHWDFDKGWVSAPGRYAKQPTHWQPLPAAPDSNHITSRILRGASNEA